MAIKNGRSSQKSCHYMPRVTLDQASSADKGLYQLIQMAQSPGPPR